MATVIVQRPTRRPSPELPSGELILEAPPEIPTPSGPQWMQRMMFLPMLLIMGFFVTNAVSGPARWVLLGVVGVIVVVIVVVMLLNAGGASKREMGTARRLYLRSLAQHRLRLRRSVNRQRDALVYLHPEPNALWSLLGSYRLWERRTDDADFAVTRVGTGAQSPATVLIAPETKPLEQLEPLSALALRRFIKTFSAIPDLPLAVALTGFSRIYLRGDQERAGALARAMVMQLASLHAPDDVRIAVCAGPQDVHRWDWVKWLPHALHPERYDAAGAARLVAPTIPGIEAMMEDLLVNRPRFDPDGRREPGVHLVVVLDGGSVSGSDHLMTGTGVEGVTVLDLTTIAPRALDRSALCLDIEPDGTLTTTTFEAVTEIGTADGMDIPTAEGLARQLAPLRLTAGARGEQPLNNTLGLAELLDIGDPYAFEPTDTWLPRPNRDRLRVTFGIQPDGAPIEIDLKESAQDGMGPHGLLIGATGSGKSELLRTLVLSLAITHPPNSLNFALVDFKGGATFTRLDQLPHTSAVITNLADELPLVDRMTDAINGELIRRQELLRAAGNFSSLRDYERARAAGAPLPEVPVLLVICDEFSELLSAKPDFIDTFVQIGRVGRSLGVHLLLASQRLEEGRLRGLDAHLSFRVGLRTFSAMDSRTVLGVNDAFELPRAPGHGYLKFSTEPMVRFRSAYVSGVHFRPEDRAAQPMGGPRLDLMEYSTRYLAPKMDEQEGGEQQERDDDAIGESLLDILVDRLAGKGTPAHQVWLPPLDESPSLDTMFGGLVEDPQRGLCPRDERWRGGLQALIGVVDRPFEQLRDNLVFDLSAGSGHFVVVGGPRSGKTTTLRTLVSSLALTHTPREVQFYCLDFGGGGLATLRGLPHVGGITGRQNTGAVRRTVAQVSALLNERERRFAEFDVDGMDAYRKARARGEFADDPYGDVFLVVDGWQTLRKDFEDTETIVNDIAARGLAYGVHVVAACARWMDMRPAARDMFNSKLELRLGDAIDSIVNRMSALNVPEDTPGRGLILSKHHVLVGVPRVDGLATGENLQAASTDLGVRATNAWRFAPAPEVRLLPGTLPYADLPPRDELTENSLPLTLGISEEELAPVRLDFRVEPNVMLFGDVRTGKSTFLRSIARRIVDSYTPQQARIVIIDHRRSLLGDIDTEHLLGHGTEMTSSRSLLNQSAQAMAERVPGNDVTPAQLRKRDWWTGPELFVLVDDYDLVVTPMENPLSPLLDFLPQAAELGLHLIVTRRIGGAGRAMFEPFLSRMRDLGSAGVMLSGSKDEGPLLGGLKPDSQPPGRGRLITRTNGVQLLQLAWTPPTETE